MRTPVKKVLFAFMCSAVLLTGCGGGDDNPTPAPVGTNPTPPPVGPGPGPAPGPGPGPGPGPSPSPGSSGLLPFLTGTGALQLLDPSAAIVAGTNPKTVDTGLAPPPISFCTADEFTKTDCFGQAEAFYAGTVTGTVVSNLRAARLAYAKRAPGNNTGGAVFKLDLTQGAANLPVQISSVLDACRTVRSETTDFANTDNSAVVVERAGADGQCSTTADNVVTVIRLNSLSTDAGIPIPLSLNAGNPLHAQTDASGVVTGYVSFEGSGAADSRLVRRDANLANPVTLQALSALNVTSGSNIERAGLTHLFVTATPAEQGLKLFRVESAGTLSPVLHSLAFNGGNPIQDGLHDGVNLYFSDVNKLLRIPVGSTTQNAEVITAVVHPDPTKTLRIGNRTLDTGAAPARANRLVFDAVDENFGDASGVFSAEVTATNATATTLKLYPPRQPPAFESGSSARLLLATNGRAYINVTHHGAPGEDALKINTDGTDPVTILGQPNGSGAYWAGSNRKTSFDLATVFAAPAQFIFLARHEGVSRIDTLTVVDPATGLEGIEIGRVMNTGDFQAVHIIGLGRYALARAVIDRFPNRDNDVYALDAETAGSLRPIAETFDANDIPLGN